MPHRHSGKYHQYVLQERRYRDLNRRPSNLSSIYLKKQMFSLGIASRREARGSDLSDQSHRQCWSMAFDSPRRPPQECRFNHNRELRATRL
jgi:hypothetical protein